jgi:hypothetical protein
MLDYDCKGIWRRSICVFGIEDLPFITRKKHFIVNKFLLEYDPIAYQCMEEWFAEKKKKNSSLGTPLIDVSFYCKFIKAHSKIAYCP